MSPVISRGFVGVPVNFIQLTCILSVVLPTQKQPKPFKKMGMLIYLTVF